MPYKLGKKSLSNLVGVDERLVNCVLIAIELSECDFSVVEGLRTIERQKQLVEEGKSWTMDSYHLKGLAVDIYPWKDGKTDHSEQSYKQVAKALFKASQRLGLELEWGGFWKTEDNPHWQLVNS